MVGAVRLAAAWTVTALAWGVGAEAPAQEVPPQVRPPWAIGGVFALALAALADVSRRRAAEAEEDDGEEMPEKTPERAGAATPEEKEVAKSQDGAAAKEPSEDSGPPARTAPRLFGAGLSEAQLGVRKIKSTLNKLTRERFDTLYAQLLALCLEASEEAREELVDALADEVFAKATTQHLLVDLYVDVCLGLRADLQRVEGLGWRLKRRVTERCHGAFVKYLEAPAVNAELGPEEQQEELAHHKIAMIGNMLFTGHLLRKKMLVSSVALRCADRLLKVSSPDTLETLCAFFDTVGGDLDSPEWEGYQKLDAVFARLLALTQDEATPTRIRVLIRNLLDKRLAGWRSPVVGPAPQPPRKETMEQERRPEATPLRQRIDAPSWRSDAAPALSPAASSASSEGGGAPSPLKRIASIGGGGSTLTVGRRCTCRFFVGLDDGPEFSVCKRLIGPRGVNMKSIIAEVPDAKIRIRGHTSGYLEGPAHEESPEPLMVCVSSATSEGLETAASMVEALIRRMHDDYLSQCRRRGLEQPVLEIVREDGTPRQ